MIDYGNIGAEVCVIGRTNFSSGIGTLTYCFSEALSRSFPTCILPVEPHFRALREIMLPNGRVVPVWAGQKVKASIFVDVFWNGITDFNYYLVPQDGLRLACIVWDSDQFPDEWMNILNNRYDAAVITSPHLRKTLVNCGCEIPIVCVPPPLDLEPLLRRPYSPPKKNLRVGCIAAFHPRKGIPNLLDAFAKSYGNSDNVELLIHSNLVIAEVKTRAQRLIDSHCVSNVVLSGGDLSIEQKNDLLETIDVFANVSGGEGYSIGPREALALGKVCVLSNVGGHQELSGQPGVFMVDALQRKPARYPEIDNRIFGEQRVPDVKRIVEKLKEAVEYCRTPNASYTQSLRRSRASDFSFSKLSDAVAFLIKPELISFRKYNSLTSEQNFTQEYKEVAAKRLAKSGSFSSISNVVVQMHDGGFYSIFNSFFSHLVWHQRDGRCHSVLPDWDVSRFIDRNFPEKVISFCYGQPEDGNIWTKFFEPLYGMSEADMQRSDILYDRATLVRERHNERCEPLLTYINAYKLYHQPWFPQFRCQYHRVFRDHIQLESKLKKEVSDFVEEKMHGRIMLGAHVRHPSHTVEQPNAAIAHADKYIESINKIVYERGLTDSEWGVFLATDQVRVVERFWKAFGSRLAFIKDVRRTTEDEDAVFDAQDNKNVDGFQLQHLVSASRARWSTNMAREVIRDTHILAQCDTVLHVVSNVSTAVSYINPSCKLVFCG